MDKRPDWIFRCETHEGDTLFCRYPYFCTEEFKASHRCTRYVAMLPDDLSALEANARVGRAVEEWLAKTKQWLGHAILGYVRPEALLEELTEVVEKAKAGVPHA